MIQNIKISKTNDKPLQKYDIFAFQKQMINLNSVTLE